MLDYDPAAVQPDESRVDDELVQRAVDVSLQAEGVSIFVEGAEFAVDSVRMYPPLNEECRARSDESLPTACAPVVEGSEGMGASYERDAYGAEVHLRLDEAVQPLVALREFCPPVPLDGDVGGFIVHAFVYAAEEPGEDRSYLFAVHGQGETVSCGGGRRGNGEERPTDPELEEPTP